MNGAIKFHNPDGPAFNHGELWKRCDGTGIIGDGVISGVVKHGTEKWDSDVYYTSNGVEYHKNTWSFQVRYMHSADGFI